jgi:hypothetical protein
LLETHIPAHYLLRSIDRFVELCFESRTSLSNCPSFSKCAGAQELRSRLLALSLVCTLTFAAWFQPALIGEPCRRAIVRAWLALAFSAESDVSQILETSSNAAQIEYWNATAGETWAQFQEPLDRQIEPLGLAAIDALKPREGEHIIDIGCGCGQTSLALAARVGPTGSVVGVDISKPMLDVANRRPRPTPNLRVAFRKMDA